MGPPADKARALAPRDLLALLAPFPGRMATSLRVALICALTVLVTAAYGTPEASLSVYIVFFLIRPERVTGVLLPAIMLLFVTLVIGLVMLIAVFSIDYPVLRLGCMAGVSAALLYLTSASKLRPVGAIFAMIIGFGLDELGLVPLGEAATRELLYAWLMAAIPVGLAMLVQLLLAPSPRRLAGLRLAARLAASARRLRQPDTPRDDFAQCLREGNRQIESWLKLAGGATAADLAALRQATAASTTVMIAVDLLDTAPSARLPDAIAHPLADTLDAMAGMLAQGGYPVDIQLDLPAVQGLPPLAQAALADLHDAIVHFTEAPPAAAQEAPQPARHKAGFMLPDARSNPAHLAYALKTTAAAMFCYALYTQLDWQGIHTCFITCYIVSLGTTAETVQKLALRLAGCLVGALAGTAAMVFIVPSLSSIGELMLLVFTASWASAWVAVGSPRISYAGLQIAFAFFLCVIQGSSPGFDLTIARDRAIGILLGNIVVYLVFTRIWPVSIAGRIDQAIAALLQQWRRIAQLGDAAERRAQAADALMRHQAIGQDLGLIPYEPSWVRPGADWVAARRRALAELTALEAPLFLAADRMPGNATLQAQLRGIDAITADLMPKEPAVHAPA
ncbi:MAG TPA: FUSC family protein [Bordetella sp.]